MVLDQFEQWLHGHPEADDGDLVRALRQCDGSGLQALLLVRDDFWMAITRFLRVLEVRPIEGVNSAAVEPFDARHAGRVLAELGRALGRLHDPAGPEETRFLERAVKELAGPDGRVIPVRLTLLAEMLRHRDWTTATLRDLGRLRGDRPDVPRGDVLRAYRPAGAPAAPARGPGRAQGRCCPSPHRT